MKPQPLDLEEDEIQERVKETLKNREDYKYLYDIFEKFCEKSKSELNNGFIIFPNREERISIDVLAIFQLAVKETINELKQHLKSALQGLIEDIRLTDLEWVVYSDGSQKRMSEKERKEIIIDTIKKWFPDVVEDEN